MQLDQFKELLTQKGIPEFSFSGRYYFASLQGSSINFIISSVFNFSPKTILLIVRDREEALYRLNDLQHLNPNAQVFFFPASAKIPYNEERTINASRQERSEVLSYLSSSISPSIIISTAEAISEKVVSNDNMRSRVFEISLKEKISLDFFSEYLNDSGFERVEFVSEPGQYAIRGGLLDVFSYSSDEPNRVEFFGDEVESIRSFDPSTQISNKNYGKIKIIPNLSINDNKEKRVLFFDWLSKDALVVMEDGNLLMDQANKYFKKAKDIFDNLNETIQSPPEKLFANGDEIIFGLSNFNTIEFGSQPLYNENRIEFNQHQQPAFNKNFNLLAENLIANHKSGYKNYLYTDSQKQAERLSQIFEDMPGLQNKDKDLFETIFLSIHEGFIDHDLKIAVYTDHQIFDRYHKYQYKSRLYEKSEALSLKELQELNPGDYISHIDHGIGRFAGLEKVEVNGKMQEAIRLVYKDNDVLFISIHSLHRIARFSGKEGQVPRIDKLGSTTWSTLKNKTKKKVKEIAYDLISLYAKRKSMKGFAFAPDNYLQHELEASFMYEDTVDQLKSTRDIKRDMESDAPMDRLICGDVGFGKTEVAIRAAFKAVCDSKQVAILVPTTILAMQHYKTLTERLKGLPCNVDYINRFKSTKDQKETLAKLANGEIDILVGTHKIVGKDVKFKDLGLLIIDEEQKFGVSVKDKLKTFKTNVDTLTLTATPIPRTLQFSLMGARDLSVISTPPANRYPVETELSQFSEEVIRDAVSYEINRGGQVFFIHNKVENIKDVAGMISRLVPDAKVGIGHGQMPGDQLEETMLRFMDGTFDVLVSTTIVESGLDISNANTIIINDAQNFGLSDLHQMRGRVGRSNKKAFCYLFVPQLLLLTNDARRRLKALTDFNELGSGFQIAMRDLDIRGAGNLMGAEQSGYINDMGFETYMKILNEAMEELKEEDWYKEKVGDQALNEQAKGNFSRSFVKETQLETDYELLIPDYYVSNSAERLKLYRALDEATKELDLIKLSAELKDRFGPLPKPVANLLVAVKIRWKASELGFEKLVLKNNKMIAYFISKKESKYYSTPVFQAVLNYAQRNPGFCSLKEANEKLNLVINGVRSVEDVIGIFNFIDSLIPKDETING